MIFKERFDYEDHRYTRLTKIKAANVGRNKMEPVIIIQIGISGWIEHELILTIPRIKVHKQRGDINKHAIFGAK